MGDRRRRAARPVLERVESRELLASGARVAAWRVQAAAARAAGAVQVPSEGLASSAASQDNIPAGWRFRGVFSGPHRVSSLRGSAGSKVYSYRGLGGTTSFLHGEYTMGVSAPGDPSRPFTGQVIMQDKNTNSGAVLGLALTGNRTDVDGRGRPTRLAFTVDPTQGAGIYTDASGEGTVEIRYGRNVATVVFQGRVTTNRLANPLANSDLYANGQGIVPLAPTPVPASQTTVMPLAGS